MKKLFLFVIVINLVLGLVQVLLSAKRATDGEALAKLNYDLAKVRLENARLQTSIYELSSLELIQQKAVNLALTVGTTKYLNLELPVARVQ